MFEVRLSARERVLAFLIKKGYKTCQIRNLMNIKTSTVVTYRKRLYEKFGVSRKRELIKRLKNYEFKM